MHKALISGPTKPDNKYFGIGATSFKDRFKNRT